MTYDGQNGAPALAPDGRTIAYIHVDAKSSDASVTAPLHKRVMRGLMW